MNESIAAKSQNTLDILQISKFCKTEKYHLNRNLLKLWPAGES